VPACDGVEFRAAISTTVTPAPIIANADRTLPIGERDKEFPPSMLDLHCKKQICLTK